MNSRSTRRLAAGAFFSAISLIPLVAAANPHPLPYSYPYQTLPKGRVEVEEIVDLVPVRVAREKEDGTRDAVTAVRSQLQTELEIGLRDRLELALYFSFHQSATADTPALRFDGMKQRLRYRFAEEGDLPLDLGVYLEVAELYNEIEIEEKILMSRRFGYLTAVCNLWIEQEYYFQTQEWKHVYNPTLGASYEFSPSLMLGLEYWARGRFDKADPQTSQVNSDSPSGARHYLGPTLLLQSGESWWSTGVYARLDHLTEAARADDPYGKVWVRTMVGLGFLSQPISLEWPKSAEALRPWYFPERGQGSNSVSDKNDSKVAAEPVYVIESIPVGGEHGVSAGEVQREGIPLPDHLRLFREIGRGGMGRIHPATDRNLLRHVALKRLDKELAKVPMYRDGFIAEAQMTGQLEHPNIVPVHELAVSDLGVPYFTMKLVQGVNLDDWLREPLRSPGSTARLEDGLEVFLKVCDAVAYAHHRGVIHRDLKPENVMVADFGQTYLMDWGLARLTRTRPASGEQAQMEAPGPVGTPTHMAPEQARGNPQEMDERSDVFGLGAILYEIVSGKQPYGEARDVDTVLKRAAAGQVVPIDVACMGIGVSKRIRSIVDRAVAPKPEDRYPSVVELQADVRNFLRGGLHLPRRVFPPGSIIIREGDVGDAAYMIVSGRCKISRRVGSEQESLGSMGAGDVFGEMALLLEEPRAATIEAEDNVTVLVLDQRTLSAGLGADGWTGALVRALAQRFRDLEQTVREAGVRRG